MDTSIYVMVKKFLVQFFFKQVSLDFPLFSLFCLGVSVAQSMDTGIRQRRN